MPLGLVDWALVGLLGQWSMGLIDLDLVGLSMDLIVWYVTGLSIGLIDK